MPLLADVRLVRTWSGVMAFTDDLAPIVGESARVPGFFTLIATTGFTLSPLMAQLLAEELATGRGKIPPEYAVDRTPVGRPRPSDDDRPNEETWTETTFSGAATGPPARRPSARTAASTRRRCAPCSTSTSARGCTAIFVNGTSGEWFSQTPDERRLVAETAIDAGRRPRSRSSSAAPSYTAARGRRARPPRARRRAPTGSARRRRPTRRPTRTRPSQYFRDISDGVDGPVMVYNWPHGSSVDIGPDLAERLVDVENVVAIKDSTPDFDQFSETVRRVVGRVRVFGPFMSVAGLELLLDGGRRRLHRRRLALRRARRRVLGERLARRHRRRARPRRPHRRALPEALAPRRLGRPLRRLPEPAEGPDGDARPARRHAVRAAAAPRHRRGEPRPDARGARGDGPAPAGGRPRERLPRGRPHRRSASATSTRRSPSTAAHVGFDDVRFDWTGEVPGIEALAGRGRRRRGSRCSRAALRRPVGPGRIKLVQVLDGDGPPPPPEGQAWGEVGVCEICLHVRGVEDVHARARRRRLRGADAADQRRPSSRTTSPSTSPTSPIPWGTKLELIEWTGLWRSLPGPARPEGVNHVAFGVTDMARTRAFYDRLGFTELLFESTEFFDPMAPWYRAPWYEGELPAQHMTMPMRAAGRRDRAGRPRPARPRLPRRVGPPRADGVRGRRGQPRGRRSPSSGRLGVELAGEPQTVDVGSGEWRYAYFAEPDGNYVSLVEARY